MTPRRPDMPSLRRVDLDPDPIVQFEGWFALAVETAPLAEAMTLATVDAGGGADARMVLLKGVDHRGFRFFTNYESAKAGQLAGSATAALVLYWRELDRQVRVRGTVERLAEEESDAYFASRDRSSQLGAWASPQSQPLSARHELETMLAEVQRRFGEGPVPRPPHWGGFLVHARSIEFWQGQVGRLHDRFLYARSGDGWSIERLGP